MRLRPNMNKYIRYNKALNMKNKIKNIKCEIKNINFNP